MNFDAAIVILKPSDADAARRDIEDVVTYVRADYEKRRAAVTGAKRRDYFKQMLDHVSAARRGLDKAPKTPGLADPLVWAQDRADNGDEADGTMIDTATALASARRAVAELAGIEQYLQSVERAASAAVVKHRPTGSEGAAHRDLTLALVSVYGKHTGGLTPSRGAEARFARFVCAVGEAAGLHVSNEAVDDDLRRFRADPETRWLLDLDWQAEAVAFDE